jgi:hypothetical protein
VAQRRAAVGPLAAAVPLVVEAALAAVVVTAADIARR